MISLNMPAKNVVKYYLPNSIYHIYNRGVEKRKIFLDDQDYKVFLTYLKEYLSSPSTIQQGATLRHRDLTGKYFDEIILLGFCLMPNHYHLLIKQRGKDSIKNFTRSLFTRYSMYFNKRYSRVGSLFQGIYKGTNVINKEHLLYVSKYIHLNPREFQKDITRAYSSYSDYLGITNTKWLNKNIILKEFKLSTYMKYHKIETYKQFVEVYTDDMPRFDFED